MGVVDSLGYHSNDLSSVFLPKRIGRAYLDERLDLTPLRKLLSTHPFCDFQWVSLDTGDDGVGVGPLLGTLIVLLDNNDFLASLAAGEDDGDL